MKVDSNKENMKIKFFKKFKVFKCYLFILGWIGIIFVSYLYWKLDSEQNSHGEPFLRKEGGTVRNGVFIPDKQSLKKIKTYCNFPERIRIGHEGESTENYDLSGILMVFRHGDRGPLMEVRNFSSLNCGHKKADTEVYSNYVSELLNVSKTNAYIKFVGPFMKYPIVPAPTKCTTTHLTPLGVTQLLRLGKWIKDVYIDKLNILSHPWGPEDVAVHSTKFRRTFQSALAFLYGFLPKFDLSNIHLRDIKGTTFCGDFCHCEKASVYERKFKIEKKEYIRNHPGVTQLVSDLNSLLRASENDEIITSPYVMKDALLSYACHGAKFPCNRVKCASPYDLAKLIAYEEWESKQKGSGTKIKSAKLNSFGFLNTLIDSLNKMIDNGTPKISLYSGHDKSINNILTALGVQHYQTPYYASRVIFELYRNTSREINMNVKSDYHFRLVYNGKDLTKYLTFCNYTIIKRIESGAKHRNIGLCSVVSLENYVQSSTFFKEMNVSNFDQACMK